MLTVLMCLLVLRVPSAVGCQEVAYPGNCEVYGQQVPQPGRDIRECLVRGWWWRVDGELVWLGCRDSARQLSYLLHRFGIYLPHNPPKDGDLELPPFNIFLHPEIFLDVEQPTETPSSLELRLVRRALADKKAAQKFADAGSSSASAATFSGMGGVQGEALQRHPDEALVHLPNHADPATYTAANTPVWAGVLAIHHAQEEHCV